MKITKLKKDTEVIAWGTNPCSEIILRPKAFCNLTEVVCRSDDTLETLSRKVRIATILGTIQSTLTDFNFLSEDWKKNCEEERLLGVSLTGIFDNHVLADGNDGMKFDKFGDGGGGLEFVLRELREVAVETNKLWADRLGIPASAAITCVKPSGTVSQLVDSSSGIHPRFAPYYIRNIRMDNKDPVCKFLVDAGVPCEPDETFPESQVVFSFPVAAPSGSVTQVDAINHLKLWKMYQDHWCEHKPSVTVLVEDKEWPSVGGWVYDNFDAISGVAFLPKVEHTYRQAPYIAISKEEYEALEAKMPKELNWDMLVEHQDQTTASQELACHGSSCEII